MRVQKGLNVVSTPGLCRVQPVVPAAVHSGGPSGQSGQPSTVQPPSGAGGSGATETLSVSHFTCPLVG